MKAFVSTYPFGVVDDEPLQVLQKAGIDVELNPYERKITPEELIQHIGDADILIAGTEKLDETVLKHAKALKLIARVGIGLDGIDFEAAKARNIALTYTPDAVTHAVAELTVGHILSLARQVVPIHSDLCAGKWNRRIGFELRGKTVGLIGFGRVGQRVAELLQGFRCRILANDIAPDEEVAGRYQVQFVSKEEIYDQADVISLHLPRTALTHNMINTEVMHRFKPDAVLINTARGGIINEHDLYLALKENRFGGAAVDVFEEEPYNGPLTRLDNIILTAHSGSCSREARYLMELGAAEDAANFKLQQPYNNPVPDDLIQMEQSVVLGHASLEWNEVYDNSIQDSDMDYRNYRQKWIQYPVYRMVSEFPLNVDIELVKNDPTRFGDSSLMAYMNSHADDQSQFMDASTFDAILGQVKSRNREVAVKLGGRGSSLGHPQLDSFLKKLQACHCVETIIAGDLVQFADLSTQSLHALVDYGVSVLNVYTSISNFNVAPLDPFIELLKYRLGRESFGPKIRVIGYHRHSDDPANTETFLRFWRHWADVITWPSPQDMARTANRHAWDTNRLWQRLSITHDGTLLANANDLAEDFSLGHINDCTIEAAWQGNDMQLLRDFVSKSGESAAILDAVKARWGGVPPT